MQIAFETQHDGTCTVDNFEGIDHTIQELAQAYETVREAVETDAEIAPGGLVNPEAIHGLTIMQLDEAFPAVRDEDLHRLGSVVDVPVTTAIGPSVRETFSEAVSTLGKWNLTKRPNSLAQTQQAQQAVETQVWK